MLAAAVLLLLAPDLAPWVEALDADDPRARREAIAVLREAEPAAAVAALEAYEPRTTEGRRLAAQMLRLLLKPKLDLRAPPFLGAGTAEFECEIRIENPWRSRLDLGPFWRRAGRAYVLGRGWWVSGPVAAVRPAAGLDAGQRLVVPPGGARTIRATFARAPSRRARVTLGYRGGGMEFSTTRTLVFVNDPFRTARRAARSLDVERRRQALRFVDLRIAGKAHGLLTPVIRSLAAATDPTLRLELAGILARGARHADHLAVLVRLVSDRDAGVAAAALAGVAAHVAAGRMPTGLARLVARSFATGRRADGVAAMLGRLDAPARRALLGRVLGESRTRTVHARACALLRADGIAVHPHPVTGLVTASDLSALR